MTGVIELSVLTESLNGCFRIIYFNSFESAAKIMRCTVTEYRD